MIAGAVLDCGNFNLTPITPPLNLTPITPTDYPMMWGLGCSLNLGLLIGKKFESHPN